MVKAQWVVANPKTKGRDNPNQNQTLPIMTQPPPNPTRIPGPTSEGDFTTEGDSATEGATPTDGGPATGDAFPEILRHRTAIRRANLSVPIQCLLRDGLLDPDGW